MVNIDATTPQLKVLKAYGDAIASRDLKNGESLFSKDCIFRTFPQTAEHPDLTKEQYLQSFGGLFSAFREVELTCHDVIEAPGKLVVQHTLLFTTADGSTIKYDALAIFSLIEEDGDLKFIECKNFVDSSARSAFSAGVAKTMGTISA